MQIIGAEATRAALPFPALVDALRAMFESRCEVPGRHVHEVRSEGGTAVKSLVMPAWNDRYYGVKIVNVAPGNVRLGLPGLHSSYLLHDARTGQPLALIDGDEITARRTAAASALAASFLARPDSCRLLVVGAGKVARLLPEAYRTVRSIERVTIWGRSTARARALALELGNGGIDAQVSEDLPGAVAEADIVSCATLATAPLVRGAWLGQGTHLDLIGSFTPAMREADEACFAGASVFVDTEEAWQKSGDLLEAIARETLAVTDVRATLAGLCRGSHAGRLDARERTVFKAVGTALEDLAAAVLVYGSVAAGRAGATAGG